MVKFLWLKSKNVQPQADLWELPMSTLKMTPIRTVMLVLVKQLKREMEGKWDLLKVSKYALTQQVNIKQSVSFFLCIDELIHRRKIKSSHHGGNKNPIFG